MIEIVLLILASIGAALAVYYIAPGAVKRWFNRIERARTVLATAFTVLVALVFLMTGSPALMLIGGVLVALLALGIVIKGPEYLGVNA